MIKLSPYHTHCTFCDGKSTAEEMILAAIDRGCPEIGFSSHSPLSYKQSWAMKSDGIAEYIKCVRELGKRYEKQIKVYVGMELDVLSDIPTETFDYVIGSVHHVFAGGKYYSVDESLEATRMAISEGFSTDAYAYCEAYFLEAAKIYERTHCNIIGHFDLLTKYQEIEQLFDESDPRYLKACDAAFDALFATPAVFEVNTGAISRGYRKTPYPSTYIMEKIRRAGMPVIVTPDTHSAATVDFMLDSVGAELAHAGFNVITSMEELLRITG